MKSVKGCLFFAALFVVGMALFLFGVTYDALIAQNTQMRRVVGISGLVLAFGAIYGAATWAYLKRKREREPDSPTEYREPDSPTEYEADRPRRQ